MIDQLNDDCQLHIINYLNTKDQLSLWKSNLSARLNANIFRAWRLHVDSYYFFQEFKNNIVLLNSFLCSICETLQSLKLKNLRIYHLDLLQNYRFPNLRKLYIDDFYNRSNRGQHEFELLPKLFPELTSLTLQGMYDVKWLKIAKFRKLRRVVLWNCGNVAHIFGSESLEELLIDMGESENYFHCNALMCLPKLQTLALLCDDFSVQFLQDIIRERSNDITELSMYFCIKNYYIPTLQSLKRLLRLTLINEYYPVNDLQNIVSGLPLLDQLDLIDCELFSTEIQLWKTIAVSPSLKVLNISGLKLTNDFFEPTRHYMEQALRNRTVPLTLHWHNTGFKHLVSTTDS